MPKVSVLMPVYNSRHFLSDALQSILFQTFTDFEFIIVDDGSTDGSDLILDEYAKKDKRIKILKNNKNKGIVFSLNRGLQICKGDYILRMDADDIAFRYRLERQVAIMDADPDISALGSALSYIDAEGKELGVIRLCQPAARLLRSPLLHPTVLMRRKIFLDHNLRYEEKYLFAEDYFLWLKISRLGKISATDEVLLKYRLNNDATKIRRLKGTLWATLKVKRDAVIFLKFVPSLKEAVRFFLEILLLFLPSRVILFVYLKSNFKEKGKIRL